MLWLRNEWVIIGHSLTRFEVTLLETGGRLQDASFGQFSQVFRHDGKWILFSYGSSQSTLTKGVNTKHKCDWSSLKKQNAHTHTHSGTTYSARKQRERRKERGETRSAFIVRFIFIFLVRWQDVSGQKMAINGSKDLKIGGQLVPSSYFKGCYELNVIFWTRQKKNHVRMNLDTEFYNSVS